ncbi:hypothetical protein ACVINY_002985 [Sinorhizobium meliloti]
MTACFGGRGLRLGYAFGDRFGDLDREAARFHGAGEAPQKGRVVIDDQKALVRPDQVRIRGVSVLRRHRLFDHFSNPYSAMRLTGRAKAAVTLQVLHVPSFHRTGSKETCGRHKPVVFLAIMWVSPHLSSINRQKSFRQFRVHQHARPFDADPGARVFRAAVLEAQPGA